MREQLSSRPPPAMQNAPPNDTLARGCLGAAWWVGRGCRHKMRRQWGICSTNPQPNADLAAEPPPSSLHPIETWPDLEHYARSKVGVGLGPCTHNQYLANAKCRKRSHKREYYIQSGVGRKDTAVRTTYVAPIYTSHGILANAPLDRLGFRRGLVNIKVSPDKPYRCQAPAGSAGIQPRRSQTRWQSLDSLIECCVRLEHRPQFKRPPVYCRCPTARVGLMGNH